MPSCKACDKDMDDKDLIRKDKEGDFEELCYTCLVESGVDLKEEEEFNE